MDIMEIMRGNRTYRRFLQEPVPEAVLTDMLEAARITNCGMNAQVMRYVVVTNPDAVAKINANVKMGGMVPEYGLPREGECPTAYIALLIDGEANHIRDIDTGIAAHTLSTVAYSHGIGSCMIAAFSKEELTEIIGLKEGETISLLLALGKPAHTSTIVEPKEGSLKYFVDDELNFYVPKRPLSEIVRFIK